MKFLLLAVVLVLFVSYVTSGYLAARRYRVPFGRVLSAQWAGLRRSLVLGAWAAMVLPLAWTVIAEGSSDELSDYFRSWWLLYAFCAALLWVVGAWPFKSADRRSNQPSRR